jgi:maltose O-acetyltransferase
MHMHFHLFNLASGLLPGRFHAVRAGLLRCCGAAVGGNVSLNASVRVYGNNLEIGADTWLSSESVISTTLEGRVTIGSRCDIGPGVWMITGSHELGPMVRRAGKGTSRPIVIGDGCWIGARSILVGGATVGAGSVVGAGALVLAGDYPPNVLLAGVPAVIKKKLSPE